MNKYEEMSDFEVNRAVASIVTDGDVIEWFNMANAPTEHGVQVIYKVGVHGEYLDYCNNPSDAWAIIVDNKINLLVKGGDNGYYVTDGHLHHSGSIIEGEFEFNDKNPLRAAMIVFLMMKESEQCN